VLVLPGRRSPEFINDDETLLESPFVVPPSVSVRLRRWSAPWDLRDTIDFCP
jgi:hypothetical protein